MLLPIAFSANIGGFVARLGVAVVLRAVARGELGERLRGVESLAS